MKDIFDGLDPDFFRSRGYDQDKIAQVKSLMIIVAQTPDLMAKWEQSYGPVDPFDDFNQYLFEACEWCYDNQEMIKQRGTH